MADVLVERREFYGDEVLKLLDDANLVKPDLDLTEEVVWPQLA